MQIKFKNMEILIVYTTLYNQKIFYDNYPNK